MFRFASFLILLLCGSGALAEEGGEARDGKYRWYAQAGAYVHWNDSDEFRGLPWFGGIEYHRRDDWFAGLSLFNNSFGQFSQYLYLGKTFHPSDSRPEFRVKLSAGIVHGYRGEHYDTLPIRWGGSWGLGFVPAIGYQKGRVGYDVATLGIGGLLFLVGFDF